MDNVSDGIELWYVVDWLADKLVYQYVINALTAFYIIPITSLSKSAINVGNVIDNIPNLNDLRIFINQLDVNLC